LGDAVITDPSSLWAAATALASERNPMLATLLESVALVAVERGQARLTYGDARKKAMLERSLPKVAELLAAAGGGALTPSLTFARSDAASEEAAGDGGADVARSAGSSDDARRDHKLLQRARTDAAIKQAMHIFDATVVAVEVDDGAGQPAGGNADADDVAESDDG
jgi:hypothetical protein